LSSSFAEQFELEQFGGIAAALVLALFDLLVDAVMRGVQQAAGLAGQEDAVIELADPSGRCRPSSAAFSRAPAEMPVSANSFPTFTLPKVSIGTPTPSLKRFKTVKSPEKKLSMALPTSRGAGAR
jgi:hypothetical protein